MKHHVKKQKLMIAHTHDIKALHTTPRHDGPEFIHLFVYLFIYLSIYSFVENPSCNFNQGFCQWNVSEGWKLSRRGTLGNEEGEEDSLQSTRSRSKIRCLKF